MDEALSHLKSADPVMTRLIAQYSRPTFTKHANYYQELVSGIIGQQLSLAAARAIETRFRALFGGNFPAPEEILTIDVETLRGVGFSRPKARYVQDLALKILDGSVSFIGLDDQSNEEIITQLTHVKGIGEWTVHMFLIFCMARQDVLPVGDLGIRNGITKLYGLEHQAMPGDVAEVAEQQNWRPYESVASWYIWQSLENAPTTTASS
ncbi:DNA-3-methyladenine glycosylase 2 family protein [Candidatus Saccharibacteria bacterium]|nr:DNA-3-methyladenine glycosylase 2 family protein [Candidatus Saccharibacteria bacterium]